MAIRAAFIGIDKYQDPLIRDLTGATRDATALWAVLSDSIQDFNAQLITNECATLDVTNRTLDETLGKAEPDDIVLLSFAGHGTRDHRLVLANSRVDDIANTTLDMADLAKRFRETRARVVLLLLDCCFSGGATARVLDVGLVARDLVLPLASVAGEGRILFAACSSDQEAFEDPNTRHGLFTKAILECLLESTEPVSVIGLVDRVVQLVRADASRYGREQTPTMFGHVEGSVQLPVGRRGDHYFSAFPDRAPIRTTGSFSDLSAYDIPVEVLDAWHDRYPDGLNQLQITAVNDYGVMQGNSLLVVAPTSAGKTFIGEMATLKKIAEGQKAVFLLPYKALVNEKYEDFSELYGERLGLRVARCSGDWQDQVGDVMRGKYDIAFFTYEKFLSLVVSAPHILNQIGLVVLDEAQFITEHGRGMVVELLLTNLVTARSRGVAPQLIALSAVIGNTNGFEHWLQCELLMTTERPVPLTLGILDRTGTWQFHAANGAVETTSLIDRHLIRQRRSKPSSQDVIVPLVQQLIAKGEKVIVFRNSRGTTSGSAEYLSRDLGLPPAQAVLDALPESDLSVTSVSLRVALQGGVAFHTSDLSREERVAVERGFRNPEGGVHVLVATSTVAAGVNTPASTVIIVETNFPSSEPKPYTVAQFKNMAGRAGRLGYESEGKAIALAVTSFERQSLFRTYVLGNPEPIVSSFNARDPGTWVVKLMAQVKELRRDAVIDLVANTFGGYRAILQDSTWRTRMIPSLEQLLDRMLRDGLLEQSEDVLCLTMLGRVCGESPLSMESALRMIELLRSLSPEQATLESLLVLTEALPERDDDYTPQTRGGGESNWQQIAAQQFGRDIARLLRVRVASDRDYYARCKRALIINDWINGATVSVIEDRYSSNAFSRVGSGDIRGYTEGSRFLFESIIRIAAIVLEKSMNTQEIEILMKRLDLGVPASALGLTELPITLRRGELLSFLNAGLTTVEAVSALSFTELEKHIGTRAQMLHQKIGASQSAAPESA